ncbi:MAG TPA: recombinase family protein [Microlunatus sp.]
MTWKHHADSNQFLTAQLQHETDTVLPATLAGADHTRRQPVRRVVLSRYIFLAREPFDASRSASKAGRHLRHESAVCRPSRETAWSPHGHRLTVDWAGWQTGLMNQLLVGYARVSTEHQDLTAQRNSLAALGVGDDRIYVDHGLTGTNRDVPGLRLALAACHSGDTLVVTKLDRLARSLPDARTSSTSSLSPDPPRLIGSGFLADSCG